MDDTGQWFAPPMIEIRALAELTLRFFSAAVPVSIDDAIQAAKIADALTYAFRSGKQVTFGEDGEAIYE